MTNSAWVYKNENGEIVALSPVCKHLGCTVDWNTDKNIQTILLSMPWWLYTKDGTNVQGTPPVAPLDVYPFKEKDGYLYLGKAKPRERRRNNC